MNFCPDLDIFDNRTLDDVFEEIENDWNKGSGGVISIQRSPWVVTDSGHSTTIKACCKLRSVKLFTLISYYPHEGVWKHPVSVEYLVDWTNLNRGACNSKAKCRKYISTKSLCLGVSEYFNSEEIKQAIRDLVAEPELLVTILHGREFSHDDLYNLFDFALTLFQKPHPWLHFSEGNKSKFIIVCNRLLGLPDSSLSMEVAMKETYGIDITNNLFFPLSGTIADSVQTFKLIKVDK
jgi:hypothetical protein